MKKIILFLLIWGALFIKTQTYGQIHTVAFMTTGSESSSTAISSNSGEYANTYILAENPITDKIFITFKEGEYYAQAGELAEMKLIHVKNDEFFEPEYQAKLTFMRKDGIVESIKIEIKGEIFEGTKEGKVRK